jgi:hypothetical protein
VQTVLKSGSLNLLEPSGPVQAFKGIAVPLPLALPQIEHKVLLIERAIDESNRKK